LYSSVNNRDNTKSILSLYELLAIIIVFAFMLYLLFPKKNIDSLLDTQAAHINLSVQYLESMILYHPNNTKLKFTLMEKYTQLGNNKKALEINHELMQKTDNRKLLAELYKIEYLLEKNLYFNKKSNRRLKKLKEKLLALYEYTKEERDYLFFFGESTNIDYRYLKYESLIHYLDENPREIDYNMEKMAYDLANELNYKEKALGHLQSLMKYPNTNEELSEYLIYSLFKKEAYTRAKEISMQLFFQSQTNSELTKHFHLALYALVQDHNRSATEISQLIQEYSNLKVLLDADIGIILNSLLELGEIKEAANFVINLFYTTPNSFDVSSMDIAIQSLLYNSQLHEAQMLSLFALGKFESQKYLDKSIEISTWMSDDETVRKLNTEGYQKYRGESYLSYFLKQENLNKDYVVLGQIYEDKIAQKAYGFIDNMANYYRHTGEIPKAEQYFKKLYRTTRQPKALYYAVEFAHHNSHFESSFKLYEQYRAKYGHESKLHQLSIEGLMALQKFDEAHALGKAFQKDIKPKQKAYLADLAWLQKDYDYLYTKLWKLDNQNALSVQNFEQLILLEKSINNGDKISYLYEKSWKKNQNTYHLTDLLYKLLETQQLTRFDEVITALTPSQKKNLSKHSYYQELLAAYYVEIGETHLALESYDRLLRLNPNNTVIHQNYLWLLIDNHENIPLLETRIASHLKLLEKDHQFRDNMGIVAVVAAMNQQKYALAKKWINRLIFKNPNQKEYQELYQDLQSIEKELLYIEYSKMLDSDYLDTHISLNDKHYGSQLRVRQSSLSHQWQLYQKIKAKIILNHYDYKAKKRQSEHNAFELALQNSDDTFLWNLQLGNIDTGKNFLTASLDLSQTLNNFNLNLKAEYQNKTELTPNLTQNALENALSVNFRTDINKKTSVTLHAKSREFIEIRQGHKIGKAQHLQLSTNYVLRSGYPDISFNTYLGHHQFSKHISKDFSEIGFAASAGKIRQHTLNHSWKPFGTLVFAVNNERNVGASAILGVSKVLNHRNSFDILFEYYNGIGVISEPIYELNLQYRF
jgi:hypothetical protein